MKTELDRDQLAAAIVAETTETHQLIAPTEGLSVDAEQVLTVKSKPPGYAFNRLDRLKINPLAHSQIAERIGVPVRYYNRIRQQNPVLWADLVNHGLRAGRQTPRLIKHRRGAARAFLSDKYLSIPHLETFERVAEPLLDRGCVLESASLTETDLYIKICDPGLQIEVAGSALKGDVISGGLVIKTSDVGMGTYTIKPFLKRLICTNGMTADVAFGGLKRVHAGNELPADFWYKVSDIADRQLAPGRLQELGETLNAATRRPVADEPLEVLTRAAPFINLTETETEAAAGHWYQEADWTQWGMANCITRTAQDADSYERASVLEETGWNVLTLPESTWRTIALN